MKKLIVGLLIVMILPVTAMAGGGTVYGNIRPKEAGIEVKIVCENDSYYGDTNKKGDYEIKVRELGKCRLKVLYEDDWTCLLYTSPSPRDLN